MKLEIISNTPNLEKIIVTSILTTTSGKKPSLIYKNLEDSPNKIQNILKKVKIQHGSVLDHNIVCMYLHSEEELILDILIKSSYFYVTKIKLNEWIISSNLRTIIRYIQKYPDDEFAKKLYDVVCIIAPNIKGYLEIDKQ